MTPRLDKDAAFKLAPGPLKAMFALEASLKASGIEPAILELVKLRASQINGCAFCIQMHTSDMRKAGESELRLYMLNAWRESPLYNDRERAALAWTETLTRVAEKGAPDEDYELVRAQFTPAEQVNLTYAIGAINVWNRLNVAFRTPHAMEGQRDAA